MDHDAEHVPVMQMTPADGWRVYYYDEEDDSVFSSLVISWGLRACGCVVPLGMIHGGLEVDDLRTINTVAIFHDSETDLEEMIQGAIEEWKDDDEERKKEARKTAH